MTSLKIGTLILAAFVAGAFVASPELRAYAANTIASTDIIDGEVKTPDLATNAVTAAKIKDGEVKTAELGGNSVTTTKIKDGGITAVDVSSGFITGGFKKDGQDGWFPSCSDTNCQGRIRIQIFNVPNARDGSVIMVTVNEGENGVNSPVCAVSDVLTESFMVTCDGKPKDGAFLDYIVINRPGI
jgi:hypothetical protein